MPKRLLKRLFPDPAFIRDHESLRFLGARLHNPNLWHLNRRSVANAFAIGLFTAFIPVPGQMLIAAVLALYFSGNLPISVTLVWTTNPVTVGPVLYAAYLTGAYAMHLPPSELQLGFSLDTLKQSVMYSWRPVLLGCLILGTAASMTSYIFVRLAWRLFVTKKWGLRKVRRPQSRSPDSH